MTASAFKVSFLALDLFHRFLRFQVIYSLAAICLFWFPANLYGFLKACLSLPLCPMQILLVQKKYIKWGGILSILDEGCWELKLRSWQKVLYIVYIFLPLIAHANNMFFFYFKFPCCGVLLIISVLRMNFPLLTWYAEVCSTDGFKGILKLCKV